VDARFKRDWGGTRSCDISYVLQGAVRTNVVVSLKKLTLKGQEDEKPKAEVARRHALSLTYWRPRRDSNSRLTP